MSSKFSKDDLYALPMSELIDFSFDQKTVAVFPDMINRSVPGYSLMQSLTGLIAKLHVHEDTRVYDLGCSLGASSLSVINSVEHQDYELILVDQSESMVARCRQLFAENPVDLKVEFRQSDIRELEISNGSLVILNLVLQFLPQQDRQAVIEKIYNGLNQDAALLLSEKINVHSEREKQSIDKLYIEFKKRSGYSELEISQKRKALEKVMTIESMNIHQKRLKQAGFTQVTPVMQALNFVTFWAIK